MLRWTTPALKDLKNILEYFAAEDEEASERIARAFKEASRQLKQFPQIGMQGRVPGTRELFLPKYPFVFIYRQKNVHIEILRLLHTHQQWP